MSNKKMINWSTLEEYEINDLINRVAIKRHKITNNLDSFDSTMITREKLKSYIEYGDIEEYKKSMDILRSFPESSIQELINTIAIKRYKQDKKIENFDPNSISKNDLLVSYVKYDDIIIHQSKLISVALGIEIPIDECEKIEKYNDEKFSEYY